MIQSLVISGQLRMDFGLTQFVTYSFFSSTSIDRKIKSILMNTLLQEIIADYLCHFAVSIWLFWCVYWCSLSRLFSICGRRWNAFLFWLVQNTDFVRTSLKVKTILSLIIIWHILRSISSHFWDNIRTKPNCLADFCDFWRTTHVIHIPSFAVLTCNTRTAQPIRHSSNDSHSELVQTNWQISNWIVIMIILVLLQMQWDAYDLCHKLKSNRLYSAGWR